jgi:hypothetical protein
VSKLSGSDVRLLFRLIGGSDPTQLKGSVTISDVTVRGSAAELSGNGSEQASGSEQGNGSAPQNGLEMESSELTVLLSASGSEVPEAGQLSTTAASQGTSRVTNLPLESDQVQQILGNAGVQTTPNQADIVAAAGAGVRNSPGGLVPHDGGSDEETDDFWPWTQEAALTPNVSTSGRDPQADGPRSWAANDGAAGEVTSPETGHAQRDAGGEAFNPTKDFVPRSAGPIAPQPAAADHAVEQAVDAVFAGFGEEMAAPAVDRHAPTEESGWGWAGLLVAFLTLGRPEDHADSRRRGRR